MIGYPLDSHVTYDTDGTPSFDRAITSEPYRKLIKSLFSDGVLPNPSSNLQVSAGTGMNVTVSPGFALCNGCQKLEESTRTLVMQAAHDSLDRIDTVVMRLDDNDSARICDLYVLTGTASASPVRPTLTQNGTVWEIGLADVFISSRSTAITNQKITDTRLETARCGVISSISQFDTTTLYQQVQADLEDFQTVNEAEFTAWFATLQNILDANTAGHLQNEIGTLSQLTTTAQGSLVAAVNEVDANVGTMYNALSANIASTYSASATYKIGEIVMYNGTVYKCTTAIKTAEAWTAGHWTATTAGGQIGTLNNSLTIQATTYVGGTSHAVGDYVIDGAGTTASPYTLRKFVTAGTWLANTEVVTSGVGAIYNNTDGKGYIMGADSVHPFSSGLQYKSGGLVITQSRITINKGGYAVKDGWCYVDMLFTGNSAFSSTGTIISSGFPARYFNNNVSLSFAAMNTGSTSRTVALTTADTLTISALDSGAQYRVYGCYPTALPSA